MTRLELEANREMAKELHSASRTAIPVGAFWAERLTQWKASNESAANYDHRTLSFTAAPCFVCRAIRTCFGRLRAKGVADCAATRSSRHRSEAGRRADLRLRAEFRGRFVPAKVPAKACGMSVALSAFLLTKCLSRRREFQTDLRLQLVTG